MTIINGFVIKSIDFSDNDKIITFYSKEYGKLNIFAPGVRKINSKNKYSVELFVESTLEIFKSNKNKLSKLKTGTLTKKFSNLSKNYFNYILINVVSDLTDMLFQENEKSFNYFKMLQWIFKNINDNHYPFKNLVIFLFKSLKYTNATWDLEKSYISKKIVYNPKHFDIKNFGIMSEQEYDKTIDKNNIINNNTFLQSLLKISKSSVDELNDIDLKIEDAVLLLKLLLNYYETVLGIWSHSFKELMNIPFLKN